MIRLSDFRKGITSTRVHSFEDHGTSVFFRDSLGKECVGMLGDQPMVEAVLRVKDLMRWVEALEVALESIETEIARVKPTEQSKKAVQSLHCLQLDMEALIKHSHVMHSAIVESLAEEAPQMMQSYLSAFSSVVGKGEV